MIAARYLYGLWAGWQSGHAADCNSVYAGSIPTPASISILTVSNNHVPMR